MLLKKLLTNIEIKNTKGSLDIEISNIHSDSRKIKEDGLFIAINGFAQNGISFIPSALENGAKAIIVEPDVDIDSLNLPEDITIISVYNTRKALAETASTFYDNPSSKLKLIGVTGTKGKTTTTFMIKEILEKAGKKVGLIGTVATYINGERQGDSDRTTPESLELQRLFYKMAAAKVDYVVMEVSSHALELQRVRNIWYDTAIFTNLQRDHLDFHLTFENYFQAKVKLFENSVLLDIVKRSNTCLDEIEFVRRDICVFYFFCFIKKLFVRFAL